MCTVLVVTSDELISTDLELEVSTVVLVLRDFAVYLDVVLVIESVDTPVTFGVNVEITVDARNDEVGGKECSELFETVEIVLSVTVKLVGDVNPFVNGDVGEKRFVVEYL